MIQWLLNPEHNALLTWIGFAIGVIGTLLGLLGIGLTLWQLKAIKSETEAARKAINSVQLRVASFDAAQECTKAKELVLGIRVSLKEQDWHQILVLYEDLIQRFLNLSHSTSSIGEADRKILIKYTEEMAKMCDAIRRRVAEAQDTIFLRGQDRALRNFADVITKVSFSVTRSLQQ
ncbi:hypothetical protein [uncultured Sphingomonas sp.]|uniref:hypothetical protein n=1 Tax=uncultured Sphingomonas sp. TaxID=158754 RepID=UPI0025FF7443|nr:hypothetical protein [uncultured Sphingomonas sp.]